MIGWREIESSQSLHFRIFWFLHLNFNFETWNDKAFGLRFLVIWKIYSFTYEANLHLNSQRLWEVLNETWISPLESPYEL